MLKNSVRNSRPNLSLVANLVLLNTAKSKLSIPSARSRGSTRCSFPKVKSAGAAKHAELNHLETLGSFGLPSREVALADADGSQPWTRVGRAPAPHSVVPLTCPLVKTNGKPR